MVKDEWKFIDEFPVTEYQCGLKAGEKVRIKKAIEIKDHRGRPTGKAHPAGEVWTVLRGTSEKPSVVWLRQADGESHTWDDDDSIFEQFERVR